MGLKPESVTPARLAGWDELVNFSIKGLFWLSCYNSMYLSRNTVMWMPDSVSCWALRASYSHSDKMSVTGGTLCCILGHFMKFTANWWWYYLIHKFKSGIKRSPAVLGTFCWRELNLINMNKTQLPDKVQFQKWVSPLCCRNTADSPQQLWLNII